MTPHVLDRLLFKLGRWLVWRNTAASMAHYRAKSEEARVAGDPDRAVLLSYIGIGLSESLQWRPDRWNLI